MALENAFLLIGAQVIRILRAWKAIVCPDDMSFIKYLDADEHRLD